MTDLTPQILEELSYSNLGTRDLAARLKVTPTQLRPFLKSLEEAKVLRLIEVGEDKVGEDKVWELT